MKKTPKFYTFSQNTLSFLLILVTLLAGCTGDQKGVPIQNYYFPVAALKTPKVYEYRSIGNDSLAAQYWYYRTIETDSSLYLTAQSYSADFIPEQFSREEILAEGSVLEELFLYDTDSTGRQQQNKMEVLHGNIFPFYAKDSSVVYLYKIKWYESEQPPVHNTLIRNRRYTGKTNFEYKGQKIHCVRFSLRESIDNFSEGHLEFEFSGTELYAKNIGLVYYKKNISADLTLEYQLHDIYEMHDLEEKFKQHSGNE